MPGRQPDEPQPRTDPFDAYLWACRKAEAKTVEMMLEKHPEFVSKLEKEGGDGGLIKVIANSQHLDSKRVLGTVEAHLKFSSEKDVPVLSRARDLASSVCGPNSSITLAINHRISALKPKRTTI